MVNIPAFSVGFALVAVACHPTDFSLEQLFSRCDLGSCFLAFFLAYSKVATIEEDINELLAKLNFSEEEAMRVVSTKVGSTSSQGFETWAIGKLMAEEKVNREAIYRVFKSLWFTKEEVNFVSLKEGAILVKFGNEDDRKRILNLSPWLFYQCLFNMVPYVKDKKQMAMEVGNAIGEVLAIDWRDRDGGWTEYMRLRVIIDVHKPLLRVVH
ncbi:hypothetical protein GOBAR_DD29870 [Gossypium barbadense]|nr:hypothetical protein GOBAR_DD29870 [Gossypium barbadense]